MNVGYACGLCPDGMVGNGVHCSRTDPCVSNPCYPGATCTMVNIPIHFQESKVAQSLYGKDHIIKGVSVHIGSAQPRTKGGHDHSSRGHHGGGRGYDYDPWANGNQYNRPPPMQRGGYYH